jgi:hypothetical protein
VRGDIVALRIEPSGGDLRKGAPLQLNLFATTRSGGKDLIPGNMAAWSSSNPSAVEVNRQGRVTARGAGSATISARYREQAAQVVFTVVE